MGFVPLPASVGFSQTDFLSTITGSLTVAVPAATRDGDLLLLFICQNSNSGAPSITPPSGWTINGSNSGNFGTNTNNALYTKVWHTGDARSGITFSTPSGGGNTSWFCMCVRSTNAASIVSHLTATVSPASTTLPVPKLPPTTVGNMRLLLIHGLAAIGGFGVTIPAVVASANNPTSLKLVQVGGSNNTGIPVSLYGSIYEDPSGLDTATTTNMTASASTQYFIRSVVLDDGDTTQPCGADETLLYEITVDPPAYSLDQAGQDADSAAANWWGGGANTLGDAD